MWLGHGATDGVFQKPENSLLNSNGQREDKIIIIKNKQLIEIKCN